jgi:hypothetical protein
MCANLFPVKDFEFLDRAHSTINGSPHILNITRCRGPSLRTGPPCGR